MLAVLDVVKHVFWNDSMYNRSLLPSEEELQECKISLLDLSTMKGSERTEVLSKCNIHTSLLPVFLRAIQHLTSVHEAGCIDDGYSLHKHVSAHKWSPFLYNETLLGLAISNSEPFQELLSEHTSREYNQIEDVTINTGNTQFTGLTVKSGKHYNGLLNQGATCYLNSLLQALFHISSFRSIIYNMPTKDEVISSAKKIGESVEKSIPYALQRLFCMMQTSVTAVGTKELTESFGWSASDSFTQHDVHEMTRVLLDNLEEKLNAQRDPNSLTHLSETAICRESNEHSSKENEIGKLFHGCLESYVSVEEVGYYGSREETFYDIQLVVKNTKNIYASLDLFFQVEILDGKNKYCLEQNGQKSYHRAEKGVRLKKVPPILLFHLTRFDYDVEQGETKVLTRWDYYNTLNLTKYMPNFAEVDTHYTLYSVLVHSGSNTGCGHYFCFIKCAEEWYKFNDEHVTFATLRQVFGDNFGGFQLNYWGSEVPHTTNAYMLIYVKTSEMKTLLRPIDVNDVPKHVMEQLHQEELLREKLRREKAEEHLYARIYFIQPEDLVQNYDEITNLTMSNNNKFKLEQSLRVRRSKKALFEFNEFLEKSTNIIQKNEMSLLWYSPSRPRDYYCKKFSAVVTREMTVEQVVGSDVECVILVTTSRNSSFINLNSNAYVEENLSSENNYQLLVHKLYDPLRLKIDVLGITVLCNLQDALADNVIKMLKCNIFEMINELTKESIPNFANVKLLSTNTITTTTTTSSTTYKCNTKKCSNIIKPHNHDNSLCVNNYTPNDIEGYSINSNNSNNKNSVDQRCEMENDIYANKVSDVNSKATKEVELNTEVNNLQDRNFLDKLFECNIALHDINVHTEDKVKNKRDYNLSNNTSNNDNSNNNDHTILSHVMRETGEYSYEVCNELNSGDSLVWQVEPRDEDRKWIFYPDVIAFQHFIKHRIPVEIKLNASPTYPTLIDVKLADDMTYEQLQLFVARLINKNEEYDHIRFTRHNPETGLPYFMKGRKKERPTLAKLLTPATSRITDLSKYLYYEFCKYTVTEVEQSHSLQFKLYNDNTKAVSSHWVLMPRQMPITVLELFSICLKEIKNDLTNGVNELESTKFVTELVHMPSSDDLNNTNNTEFIKYLLEMTSEQAWNELRLVDVWRGRIYNILDKEHTIHFENETFEESAEYRIELRPKPIEGIPISEQLMIPVYHFCINRNRRDIIETHSEPFSMYISSSELPDSLLHRIASKLEISFTTIIDWKMCLVRENRIELFQSDLPIRLQMREFCREECFRPNQREPLKAAFVGLEHAPVTKRINRREEKVIILK